MDDVLRRDDIRPHLAVAEYSRRRIIAGALDGEYVHVRTLVL
jgi:hypothetical protein